MRLLQPVISNNGRVKPAWGIVKDEPKRYPEGAYYLDLAGSRMATAGGRRVPCSASQFPSRKTSGISPTKGLRPPLLDLLVDPLVQIARR